MSKQLRGSSRATGRAAKKTRQNQALVETVRQDEQARADQIPRARRCTPFQPKTTAQGRYVDAIDSSVIVFGVGPAGTGKTYCAGRKAAEFLRRETGNKLILTRPAIEAGGERLGFLPGDRDEKFGPYIKPLLRVLKDDLGDGFFDYCLKRGRIEMVPLAFMRGESFKDAMIVADEMQNATREQFKMLCTRIEGDNVKLVIDGDPTQNDLGSASGLKDAARRLRAIQGVSVVQFTKADIVRHDRIQDIIEAYEGKDDGAEDTDDADQYKMAGV